MTDQAFLTYGLAASGAPTLRYTPARLSDIVNVKDWGATGIDNGTNDDTDAINAAINFACTLGLPANNNAGAIVFFPPGVYRISKGGTLPIYIDKAHLSGSGVLSFLGSGRDVTILRGNYNPGGQQEQTNNGFLVQVEIGDPNLGGSGSSSLTCGFKDLTIHNESTGATSGACINMGSGNNRYFDNCHFKGMTGFACTERSFGLSVRNCLFTCTQDVTLASAATRSPFFTLAKFQSPTGGLGGGGTGQITGSVGAYIGEGFFYNCHATGFDIGFSVIGAASVLHGCSATQCGIGLTTGLRNGSFTSSSVLDPGSKPGDWFTLFSGQITSNKFDRCTWGIHGYQPKGLIAANTIMGTTGPNVPATIASMSYNTPLSAVIVTTTDDHNLANGAVVQIDPPSLTDDPDGFVGPVSTFLTIPGDLTSKQFIYSKTIAPTFTSGTWNYPLEYGVKCENSGGVLFAANSIEASVSLASFVSEGGRDNNDNIVWCTRGKYGWISAPNDAGFFSSYSAGCWEYDMCGGGTDLTRPTSTLGTPARFPVIPNVKYLPGLQSNIPGHPTTGKERTFIDARATTSTFGDVISAFLVTTVDAANGTNVLTFAAVPSFINNSSGFTVNNFNNSIGVANNRTVSSTTGTTVTLGGGNLTADIVAGSRIYFNRFDGSGGKYKVRYDGEAWRRIA